MTHSRSLKPGFSLIELAIYIAIVGILMATVGPRFMSYFSQAKESTTVQTLRNTKQAIELYYGHISRYPDALRDLIRTPVDEKVAKKWRGPYMELKGDDEVPADGWENPLQYRRQEQGSGKPYDLFSYGPNGEGSPDSEWIRP